MARQPLPPSIHVCEVVRNRCLDGRPLGLTLYGLGRRIRFASTREVPAFEGDLAWFEVTPKAKTKLGVLFLRQVDSPGRKIHWSR